VYRVVDFLATHKKEFSLSKNANNIHMAEEDKTVHQGNKFISHTNKLI
jgi:hypothetical protein